MTARTADNRARRNIKPGTAASCSNRRNVELQGAGGNIYPGVSEDAETDIQILTYFGANHVLSFAGVGRDSNGIGGKGLVRLSTAVL